MDELVEDEVLEVMELDDVELEVVELELLDDFVLLMELDVPGDQKSAFPISVSLTKKWNNRRSLSCDV